MDRVDGVGHLGIRVTMSITVLFVFVFFAIWYSGIFGDGDHEAGVEIRKNLHTKSRSAL
jgi:hypothetical protein